MLDWLSKRKKSSAVKPIVQQVSDDGSGYIRPLSAEKLLQADRRKALLDLIWEQTSMSRSMFHKLYLAPISRYAELVQQIPASETHHHAYRGGMLDHGLELMYHGLRLRQSYLLPPGAAPEDQSRQTEAWSTAIAYGCLMHDVGKIAVDIVVEMSNGAIWHPWDGVISKPYRIRYIKGRDYKLHNATAALFCQHILGAEIMSWLSGYPELWKDLLYLLAGNYELADVIGEIVGKADRLSTSLNVGANPERILQAPETSQQKQWLLGMRALVKTAQDQKLLNVRGQPYWLTTDSLWLVSKVAANNLRAHLLKQGLDNVPQNNNILFDELQSHGILQATPNHRAIWKVHIEDGDWSADLTCVRVKPSLIWGSEEYPAPFNGKVAILGDGESTTSEAESPAAEVAAAVPPQREIEAKAIIPVVETIAAPAAQQHADDGVDDLLKLFSDSPPSPATTTTLKPVPTEQVEATSVATNDNVTSSKIKKPKEVKPHPKKLDEMEQQGRKALADDFFTWLKDGITAQKFTMNDTNAKIHIVERQVFIVTPGIFQRFCLEQTGQDDAWRKVQQGFEKLKLHRKRPDDLNIWACNVKGPRKAGKKIQGYLLSSDLFFSEPPMNNPFLSLVE
ncbi:MAG: TraI domain-containing protein [Betaproteobacteria bacterium]|nr:TraI domain-containing protein [Betaproteobacteria bacterium]